MIPKYSNQLCQNEDHWDNYDFVIQANVSKQPNTNKYLPNDWHINIPKNMPSVARTNTAQQQAIDIGIPLSHFHTVQRLNSRHGYPSLLSAGVLLAVTTTDCDHVRYLTMTTQKNGIVVPNRLCSEIPQETIIRAGNTHAGLFFQTRQGGDMHRVVFGESAEWKHDQIAMAQQDTLRTNADIFYKDRALQFDQIIHYAQATQIENSPLYTKVSLEITDGQDMISTSAFKAMTHEQRNPQNRLINTLNMTQIYHIDLPCSSDLVYAIDPSRKNSPASLKSLDEINNTKELRSSFINNFRKKQNFTNRQLVKQAALRS